jgi:hypothetical protein
MMNNKRINTSQDCQCTLRTVFSPDTSKNLHLVHGLVFEKHIGEFPHQANSRARPPTDVKNDHGYDKKTLFDLFDCTVKSEYVVKNESIRKARFGYPPTCRFHENCEGLGCIQHLHITQNQ